MVSGWVKLHRELLKKPIFENEKLLKVFIWCLCKATHKPRQQLIGKQFTWLEEGQFPTGRNKAGEELGLPPSTAWDYLKLLEANDTINIKSNNRFSTITVKNWGLYQSEKENPDSKITDVSVDSQGVQEMEGNNSDNKITSNEQQIDNRLTTDEQQIDTNKNVKNVKNVKNDKNVKKLKSNREVAATVENATNVADTRTKTATNVNSTRKNKNTNSGEDKIKYAEFVAMAKSEHEKLIKDYGEEAVVWMIEALDNYKGSSGKKYKSDYRAILSWVRDKAREKGVIKNTTEQNKESDEVDFSKFFAPGFQ